MCASVCESALHLSAEVFKLIRPNTTCSTCSTPSTPAWEQDQSHQWTCRGIATCWTGQGVVLVLRLFFLSFRCHLFLVPLLCLSPPLVAGVPLHRRLSTISPSSSTSSRLPASPRRTAGSPPPPPTPPWAPPPRLHRRSQVPLTSII